MQELEQELRRKKVDSRLVTLSELAVVTATLMRVRNRGLTAKKIVFQRDNHTRDQLNFSDIHLAESQHQKQLASHLPSVLAVRLDQIDQFLVLKWQLVI